MTLSWEKVLPDNCWKMANMRQSTFWIPNITGKTSATNLNYFSSILMKHSGSFIVWLGRFERPNHWYQWTKNIEKRNLWDKEPENVELVSLMMVLLWSPHAHRFKTKSAKEEKKKKKKRTYVHKLKNFINNIRSLTGYASSNYSTTPQWGKFQRFTNLNPGNIDMGFLVGLESKEKPGNNNNNKRENQKEKQWSSFHL